MPTMPSPHIQPPVPGPDGTANPSTAPVSGQPLHSALPPPGPPPPTPPLLAAAPPVLLPGRKPLPFSAPWIAAIAALIVILALAIGTRIYRVFLTPRFSIPIEIVYSDATARIKQAGSMSWSPVVGRLVLYPGDEVASGNAQRLVMSLDSENSLRMGQNTTLKILGTRRAEGGAIQVRISLKSGVIWLEGSENGRVSWVIDTPLAVILGGRSVSEVNLGSGNELAVRVWKGSLEYIPSAQSDLRQLVGEGQSSGVNDQYQLYKPHRVQAGELTPWQAWNLKTSLADITSDRVPSQEAAYETALREVRSGSSDLTAIYWQESAPAYKPPSAPSSNILEGTQARESTPAGGLVASLFGQAAPSPQPIPDRVGREPGAWQGESGQENAGHDSSKLDTRPDSTRSGPTQPGRPADFGISGSQADDVYRRASGEAENSGKNSPLPSSSGTSGGDDSPGAIAPHREPSSGGRGSEDSSAGSGAPAGFDIRSRPISQSYIPGREAAAVDAPPGYKAGSQASSAHSGRMTWEDTGSNRRWIAGEAGAPRIMMREVDIYLPSVNWDFTNRGGETARGVTITILTRAYQDENRQVYRAGDIAPGQVVNLDFTIPPGSGSYSLRVTYDNM